MSSSFASQLPLAPLGAGDLIDRALRLYRRHLFVLIRTAAPPVIIVAAGWMLLSISIRQIFIVAGTGELFWNVLLLFAAAGLMGLGYLLILVVMGGASRTLVAHLLRNDPVTARATYAAVKARFWSLMAASILVSIFIIFVSYAAMFAAEIVMLVFIFAAAGLSLIAPVWLFAILYLIGGLATTAVFLIVFFFMVGRVAYVPQIMLVEGKGIFEAIGRSFTLASGNVRRFMAMTLFTTFATLSAVMLLVVVIYIVGSLFGFDATNSAEWPAWYTTSYSIIGPIGSILLTPVWMLGLSLLYVDERVRHEGYDIELMAARQLPEMPDINVSSPLGTALHSMKRKQLPPPPMASGRVLDIR
ncbi:MAG TPA: hypothetical protein VFI24_10880 [Pyrinomonadaceae bacterium]|nr:hypothetical protein [Pyrinomonadaceae bacterium]